MDYVVDLHVERSEDRALAVASLRRGTRVIEAKGTAVIGRNDVSGRIGADLATARALRALEAQIMEDVHERIDRCVSDE